MWTKENLDFRAEECCDICGEITHNHFDCPVCKKENADTSIYGCGYWELEDEETFECEECEASFIKKGDVFELVKVNNAQKKRKGRTMGYNIRLADVDRCSTIEEISVSYNCLYPLYEAFDEDGGLRWLDAKTGEEVLPRLKAAKEKLEQMKANDFKFNHNPIGRQRNNTEEDDRYAVKSMLELVGLLLRWLDEQKTLNSEPDLKKVKFFI